MKVSCLTTRRHDVVTIALLALCTASVLPASAQTPADPEDQSSRRSSPRLWIAETPGGEYAVHLGTITAVSVHEYVVDGVARVVELTVDTTGHTVARFYTLEPVTAAPGGLGQGVVDSVTNRINDLRQRIDSAGVTNAVVKNYPTTTHAHTIEYRLSSRDSVDKLYKSVFDSWERMSGARIKVE